MIAGVSTYIKETNPTIEVIGVEANGARSMKAAFEVRSLKLYLPVQPNMVKPGAVTSGFNCPSMVTPQLEKSDS